MNSRSAIPRPPKFPDGLREFPAIVEPPIRELPEPDDPGLGRAEPVTSRPLDVPSGTELTRRLSSRVLADERVRRVLEGKRHAVLGAGRRHDDKRPGRAHTLLVIYNYTDDQAYEVWLGGAHDDPQVLDLVATDRQPPLSDEEIERAADIARSDSRVNARLAEDHHAMALLTSDVEPGDQHYGRRRAYVGFGPPDERLPRIRTIVDLSSEKVIAVDRAEPTGETS